MNLPGDGENILFKKLCDFGVDVVVGLTVEEGEMGIIDVQTTFENFEDAFFLDFAGQAFKNQPLPVVLIFNFFELFCLS